MFANLGLSQEDQQTKLEMNILEGSKWDRMRNVDIREELGTKSIIQYIEKRQLSWWGHLERMDERRPVKTIWRTRIIEKRERGRPKMKWNDLMPKTRLKTGKTIKEVQKLYMDKKKWAKFVHE